MKLAIISDIHSNLEALEATFEDLKNENADAIYCTGDIVGYAANPNEVIHLLRQKKVKCVMGNHDYACIGQRTKDDMVKNARLAITYTIRVLTPENYKFIEHLPWFIKEHGIYLTHGLPPNLYNAYISMQSSYAIKKAFAGFQEQIAFVGHTHLFKIYELTQNKKIANCSFLNDTFELNPQSRFIISTGSVGQPREDNRKAGYLIYDTNNLQITKRLIRYDVDLTIEKIKKAGLPMFNGLRLLKGW